MPDINALALPIVIDRLSEIVGKRHVLTGAGATRRYRTGYRFGGGPVTAVIRPGSSIEQWRVLQVCITANCIVIMQAANTGLTGGSTPSGEDYDRPVMIVSTLRIDKSFLIKGGKQVVCLAGASLHALEAQLAPLGREPHSVIGSSCIGASVIGGICNNSGGALVHRGPAFSELALFATRAADGMLELVNHLGIELGTDPEELLTRLDAGAFDARDVRDDPGLRASDPNYARHVRDVDAATPARYNADPRRLFEAAGSAGKVAVFAVRLDTFPAPAATRMFYIGSNDPAELAWIRHDFLSLSMALPVSAEYVHRTAFDVAARYGKDTFLAIKLLGTRRLPILFNIKARIDRVAATLRVLPPNFSDRMLQALATPLPNHLPKRLRRYRNQYEHHLLLTMADDGIRQARDYLAAHLPSTTGAFFECSAGEARGAALHRFAVASAAVRYRTIHGRTVAGVVAIDVALRRNDTNWCETLPAALADGMIHRLYYGHFFCHVFHQDYILASGQNAAAVEREILDLLAERGARFPAEHNFGHLYHADAAVLAHYRRLDPTNSFNPGIGGTSKALGWGEAAPAVTSGPLSGIDLDAKRGATFKQRAAPRPHEDDRRDLKREKQHAGNDDAAARHERAIPQALKKRRVNEIRIHRDTKKRQDQVGEDAKAGPSPEEGDIGDVNREEC